MKEKSISQTEIIAMGTRGLDHGLDKFHSFSALSHNMFIKTLKYHIPILSNINGLKPVRKSTIIISGVFGQGEGLD